MTRKMIAKATFVLMMAAAPVALSGITAMAATGPAPGTGRTGACNMLHAFIPSGGGMATAMTVDNAHGNAGMFHAVDVSGCS
jgi:hypothetical protein